MEEFKDINRKQVDLPKTDLAKGMDQTIVFSNSTASLQS